MKLNLSNAWLQAGASVTTFFITTSAMAQSGSGTSLTTVADNFGAATYEFREIASAGSYVGGAFLVMKGLLHLKAHAENPQTPLAKGAGGVLAGAALVGAPWGINMLLGTAGGSATDTITTSGLTRF